MKAKIPYFLVQIPEGLHHMDATLNTSFESSAELVNAAGLLGFSACHKEEDFLPPHGSNFHQHQLGGHQDIYQGRKAIMTLMLGIQP
jgi:hypothetical protein